MSASGNQSEIALSRNENQNSSSPSHAAAEQPDDAVAAQPHRFRMKEMEEYFRYDKERDKPSDVRTALLTVAVLVATATYQAGLSPPGGIWQESKLDIYPKQVAGVFVMGTKNHFAFGWFMFGNILRFYFSLYMIDFLTRGFPLRLELTFTIFAIAVTYTSSIITISPNQTLSVAFNLLAVLLPLAIPYIIKFFRDSNLALKIRRSAS